MSVRGFASCHQEWLVTEPNLTILVILDGGYRFVHTLLQHLKGPTSSTGSDVGCGQPASFKQSEISV